MTQFNVMSGGRSQILVDEQQLQQLQAEFARRGHELERLKSSLETLSAANGPAHFMAAAMALCNELSSRWKAERVGLGFLKGRYVRLQALSHTEKITRNMQLVQDIESAMEECLDQDVEVLVPPPKDASFVYRFTEILAGRQGPNAVISLPLRRERKNIKEHHDERYGNVVGVLTLERKTDKPFTLQEIETLRLTCDLFTARMMDLFENDRWIGVKALRGTKRAMYWAVGAKHTWAKLGAIAAAAFITFACLVDGMYRVESPFVIEVTEKRILAAPYSGPLKSVSANVNDVVLSPQTAEIIDDMNAASAIVPIIGIPRPGSLLANMDTLEQEQNYAMALSEIAKAKADEEMYLSLASKPGGEGRLAEAQKAAQDRKGAEAKAALYSDYIKRAAVTAPFDGIVLSGDLKTRIGAPFQAGEELFQLGRLDMRAELSVPEDQITEIRRGSVGVLKSTAYPDRPIKFTIERVSPVATPVSGKNVFKVRATLDPTTSQWLKPGIEGLAKVDVEKHKYAWIWTRKMVNWVRMKLWM